MDRNTLLAFLLIALVLIFTPKYMEMVAPAPQQQNQSIDSSAVSIEPKVVTHAELEKTPIKKQLLPTVNNADEKLFTLENDLYTIVVSSRGGGSIHSIQYKNYFRHDSSNVDLINGINKDNLFLSFKNLDGQSIDLSGPWSTNYNTTHTTIIRPVSLSFAVDIGEGKTITKTLTLHPDSYIIDINSDLTNVSDQVFAGVYSIGWNGGLTTTEENEKDDQVYFNSFAFLGGELEELKVKNGESDSLSFNGAADWVAIRTKYFLAGLIPGDNSKPVSSSLRGFYENREIYGASLSFSTATPSDVSLYLGPLEYDRIKLIGKDFDQVMNFGWGFIRPISKGILYVLKSMKNYIPNYGFILIIFAVVVKLLVYPLTKKSYQSTAAMQKIQPEVTALKEKYKNNPQKLNQATMELYKAKGVNPLGGCLPMLLQMPLLFALFIVFRTTIELRAEPFIWWIRDLSSPDAVFTLPFNVPIYGSHVAILPILMVVSMFIQQRMMSGGAAQQPQQKTMQYFMTGFFFLMFNSFPSGLNLYYTLFNVLTIAQQKLFPPTDTITS